MLPFPCSGASAGPLPFRRPTISPQSLLRLFAKMQAFLWADPHTPAAPYALRRPGNLLRPKSYGTFPLTCHAGNTAFPLPLHLHQTESVEKSVNGSKRTEILAKGPIYLNGKNQNKYQNSQFPEEQPPQLPPQKLVASYERQGSQQRPRGAQIFTKSRNFGKSAKQK